MNSDALPEGYAISHEPARLDLEVIHNYLARESYWAKSIPREVLGRMMANSLGFGVYHGEAQVGFARVVSDRATFAYLADVFILPAHRGRGLGKALVAAVLAHPELQGLRRWMLVTQDAHGLYEPFGFSAMKHPERCMEIHRPGIYETRGQ